MSGTWRTGKWLGLATDGPSLVVHFGMTGSFIWCEAGPEDRQDRVVFLVGGGELRSRDVRKLRGLCLVERGTDVGAVTGRQGPDVLDVTCAGLAGRLRGRRAVKVVLMDQAVLAGLGNMLSDEVLWRSGIHPGRPAASLVDQDVARLHRVMRSALGRAVRAGRIPRRAGWLSGQRDRTDPMCPRCGTPLTRSRFAGRSALWCPTCQPRVRPRTERASAL